MFQQLTISVVTQSIFAIFSFLQPSTAPSQATASTQPAVTQLEMIELGQSDQVSQKGDLLVVHYTGKLADGTVFDTTLRDPSRPSPLTFRLGVDRVIEGWQQGMVGLKVGQRRRLVIPSQLGYGERGTGDGRIPPNATLIFDVEVIYIHRHKN